MQCSIEGCESRAIARGWCNRHWKRWRQYGDPLASPPPVVFTEQRKANIAAAVRRVWEEDRYPRQHPPDCGHCKAHRGVPKPPRTQAMKDAVSAQRRAWREPSYNSIHHARLRRDRGRASDQRCVNCGNPARQWALMPSTPPEFLRTGDGRTWSIRTSDYQPMCPACHVRMDHARRTAA